MVVLTGLCGAAAWASKLLHKPSPPVSSVGGMAGGIGHTLHAFSSNDPSGAFLPKQGDIDRVLTKPALPGPAQLLPTGQDAPRCLLLYADQLAHTTLRQNGEVEEAWLYGATMCEALIAQPPRERQLPQLAKPTGKQADVLKGELWCFDVAMFPSKLASFDSLHQFNPLKPQQGSVRRGLVSPVTKDGAVRKAVWYYQVLTNNRRLQGSSQRFSRFADFVLEAQQKIIHALEEEDGKGKFQRDDWDRQKDGVLQGFGLTAVLQGGDMLEKGAVSSTVVYGVLTKERAAAISSRKSTDAASTILPGSPYYAAALSLVLHSRSPNVPTFRSDVRYFEVGNTSGWFGGGADLTPYYLFDEDATSFHKLLKQVSDTWGAADTYPKFKKWCDDYFYLPARQEHRGIGGIFFDDLSSFSDEAPGSRYVDDDKELDRAQQFTEAVCNSFMPSYLPIVKKRKALKYSEQQRHWQLLRRGRYIEFNLLYDRGVKFGLVPGGRIEAVMVSCPPLVAWDYNHVPADGSEEARLAKILKTPQQWC
eukprot:gb/GEZN01005304.1/.p1 GENE.gb/GEZN01005304.1/~~gb/GEZN01005304.1/.p1  ORF type:complete len:565 (+),score=94.09 gb/GEZN01005304.1/:97-1695(+)